MTNFHNFFVFNAIAAKLCKEQQRSFGNREQLFTEARVAIASGGGYLPNLEGAR